MRHAPVVPYPPGNEDTIVYDTLAGATNGENVGFVATP